MTSHIMQFWGFQFVACLALVGVVIYSTTVSIPDVLNHQQCCESNYLRAAHIINGTCVNDHNVTINWTNHMRDDVVFMRRAWMGTCALHTLGLHYVLAGSERVCFNVIVVISAAVSIAMMLLKFVSGVYFFYDGYKNCIHPTQDPYVVVRDHLPGDVLLMTLALVGPVVVSSYLLFRWIEYRWYTPSPTTPTINNFDNPLYELTFDPDAIFDTA